LLIRVRNKRKENKGREQKNKMPKSIEEQQATTKGYPEYPSSPKSK